MKEYLEDVINDWLKRREDIEECSCHYADGGCWFHLSPEARLDSRLESLREVLKDDPL